ncbi:C5a anaphylatoxin chemotactic receptor 1-like [Trichomycterus rosablanca]|uniref:C5a anaphylatoxin chemotactic receptor 1-like n=1 Tax=Trichomycterus rosablanca TaxID=2290929 RepID=UPI002F35F5E9
MEHFNSSNSTHTVSAEKAIASGVLGLCFLLGVPGNIAVMIRLVGWLRGDSFTPRLMMSLAVSDLLTLLLLPVWIWSFLQGWSFGLLLCKISSYMIYLGLYCSLLCVILLSLQRYLQVLYPQKWAKVGVRGQKILLGGMWMLGGVLGSYAPVERSVYMKNEQLECRLHYQNDTERVATLFLETLMFVLTFLLLTYFYFHLYRGVNRSAFFNSHKMTKLVTRIVMAFFVFSLPFTINNILFIAAILLKNDKLLRIAVDVEHITKSLIFVNSCVNPLLYAFSARTLQPPNQHTTGTENAYP